MIKEYISESLVLKEKILTDEQLLKKIEDCSKVIINAFANGKKVLTAGNGGSAADAQHMAGEFVSKFYIDRAPLPAIALTTDSSILTAVSNDLGYKNIFVRQVEALGNAGDILICISTSGFSENIIQALKAAKTKKLITIGLTGQNLTEMDDLCDYIIKVPSTNVPLIQEVHLMIEHILCALVEDKIFG